MTDINQIHVNSVYLQYSSVTIEGKVFHSSIGSHKNLACIVQAQWNQDYYGTPSSSVISTCLGVMDEATSKKISYWEAMQLNYGEIDVKHLGSTHL